MASAWGKSWNLSWLNSWGKVSTGDTHDTGSYWYKHWAGLHKKKPTLEQLIEAVQENPVEALKAVPQVAQQFQGVDYAKITKSYEMAQFIAKELIIKIELRRIQLEEDDVIEMLLLM